MPPTPASPLQILHDVFGYTTFRGPQAGIIDHVVGGGGASARGRSDTISRFKRLRPLVFRNILT